ncbi:MAG: hypothetical protein IPL12_04110 [Bacteroidetes bacterium]|nr:hypothetical protein [Bacteroidota bacterium]MBK8342571.1 hypothetical protein [Bacteroidota bacterium]
MPLSPQTAETIFNTLVEAMTSLCPPLVITKNKKDVFEIIGNTPVPYGSTKKIIPGMYFASAVIRKDMVSFYVFPIYGHPELFIDVAPIAMKCLKGKTCFNFKKTEQVNKKEILAMLKKALAVWKKAGYVKG